MRYYFFSLLKLYKAFFSGLVDEIYFVTQNEIQIAVYLYLYYLQSIFTVILIVQISLTVTRAVHHDPSQYLQSMSSATAVTVFSFCTSLLLLKQSNAERKTVTAILPLM